MDKENAIAEKFWLQRALESGLAKEDDAASEVRTGTCGASLRAAGVYRDNPGPPLCGISGVERIEPYGEHGVHWIHIQDVLSQDEADGSGGAPAPGASTPSSSRVCPSSAGLPDADRLQGCVQVTVGSPRDVRAGEGEE